MFDQSKVEMKRVGSNKSKKFQAYMSRVKQNQLIIELVIIISNNYAISRMGPYSVTSKQEGIQALILEHSNLISELISWQILGRIILIDGPLENDT